MMKIKEVERVISKSRFKRYKEACKNRRDLALELYCLNLELSERLYGYISVFEVCLRNSIDSKLKESYNNGWLTTQTKPNGFLSQNALSGLRAKSIEARERIMKNKPKGFTPDRHLAALSLGFWVDLFKKKAYAATGKILLEIFPNKEKGLTATTVWKDLSKIRIIRNRIAHHQPVCFKDTLIDLDKVEEVIMLINRYMSYLGCDVEILFSNLPDPTETLEEINKIRDKI
ncbi:MAG: hypothetical protein ACRC13_00565 [Tannerellaceae bacterium]